MCLNARAALAREFVVARNALRHLAVRAEAGEGAGVLAPAIREADGHIDRFSTTSYRSKVSPGHIRSDNGPEFTAKGVQDWIAAVGSKTAYIEPGSPWENGYCECFNAKLRDELLSGEMFYALKEASVVVEQWRRHYNSLQAHSSLGYQPPAPEVVIRPTERSSSAPLAYPAIVTRSTMH